MILSAIVAASENGVIGRDNALPWHLPADLRRFKSLTMGRTIIMGRKTWESIGRPLPGRRSIVITRERGYSPNGAEAVPSLAEALERCAAEPEAFVIGGRAIFDLALPSCRRLYLTRVHAVIAGNVRFPENALAGFRLQSDERHEADAKHPYPYSFQVYERDDRQQSSPSGVGSAPAVG